MRIVVLQTQCDMAIGRSVEIQGTMIRHSRNTHHALLNCDVGAMDQ